MPPFPFLALPLELRESIYSLYFKPADRLHCNDSLNEKGFFGGVYDFDFDLYRVNRQVYSEAQGVWRRENVFVKIATPWPSAGMYRVYLMSEEGREWSDEDGVGLANHVASKGLVPIVCTDQRADLFSTHHALVQITVPFQQAIPEHTVVVLLDDLHLFTQTWYYSTLSYPMLNHRLSTTFVLRNPSTPTTLQRRLLLPFEKIKGLHHMQVSGYEPSIHKELQRLMAVPLPSLTQCCDEAADLMDQGDIALSRNDPEEALDLYIDSFRAIHILIHQRTRHVLAGAFFHASISSGRFAGQAGITVRVILRLKLVARCVLAYLKLSQLAEAAFWGSRSIRIMRESMDVGFEDVLSESMGGEHVGLIYVRTGVAVWMLERQKAEGGDDGGYEGEGSERIWSLATKFLRGKRKEEIRKELRDFGVPAEVVGLFGDSEGETSSSLTAHGSGDEE
ncbi:hypothetical protein BDU57DRAFT_447937 [Ampelomyces quisqualis]|uniref:Uncharacterized protein n=1 Tax=Ampelomyces quisqualis TaxID=50730 RepID=A0A6A5QP43_AMPQU|nr:hypothetical protein BDU57DRAFT_447937 [Ampelomyces quisqualis]